MKIFHKDGEQWIDIADELAPISTRDLRAVSALTANFTEGGERFIQWACDSITAWSVRDAYGTKTIEGKPTAETLGDVSYDVQKWMFGLLFKAALELPLVSGPTSQNGNAPAAAMSHGSK